MLSFSACNCTANQTLANTTCDPVSGQCKCDVSEAGGRYGGRQCDTCARRTVGKCVTKNDTVNWERTIQILRFWRLDVGFVPQLNNLCDSNLLTFRLEFLWSVRSNSGRLSPILGDSVWPWTVTSAIGRLCRPRTFPYDIGRFPMISNIVVRSRTVPLVIGPHLRSKSFWIITFLKYSQNISRSNWLRNWGCI